MVGESAGVHRLAQQGNFTEVVTGNPLAGAILRAGLISFRQYQPPTLALLAFHEVKPKLASVI